MDQMLKMTVTRLFFLSLAILIRRESVVAQQCYDNDGFAYNNVSTQTCSWIRKIESRRYQLCNDEEIIQTECPFTCGICCLNDVKYRLQTPYGLKMCFWIGVKKRRKDKWCDTYNSGIMVRKACAVSCDFCQKPITPTISPSPTTPAPTICINNDDYLYNNEKGRHCIWIRNQVLRKEYCRVKDVKSNCPITCGECCADDPDYTLKVNKKYRSCKWLSQQSQAKKGKFCPLFRNGVKVQNACHKTCDRCIENAPTMAPTISNQPSAIPSVVPSLNPTTESPTKSPTISPTSSHPTESPTKIPSVSPTSSPPTENPTRIPTDSPTSSPTTHSPTESSSASPSSNPSVSPTSNPSTYSPTDNPTPVVTSCAWVQLGNYIIGEDSGDNAGPTALSSNGQVLVVGSFKNDEAGNNAGHTRIFEFTTSWNQLGSSINGENTGDKSGTSVSTGLSANGEIVVIGSPKNEDGATGGGQVRAWEWDGSNWVQKGNDIENTKTDRLFGSSLAVTSDGLTFVAGGPGKENEGKRGMVEVWTFDNQDWAQVYSTINGDSDEYFGTSVAITSDASTIAVGTPESNNGSVFVYADNGSEWAEISILSGDSADDLFGTSVALTFNSGAYLLAVGAPAHTSSTGQVVVYDSSDGASWSQSGVFDGSATGDLAGTAVDLSTDGNVLVVGYPGNDNGFARLFEYDSSTSIWNQINDDIVGVSSGDKFGAHVSVSDSFEVAVGAEKFGSNSGLVGVFNAVCSTPTKVPTSSPSSSPTSEPTSSPSDNPSYNPTACPERSGVIGLSGGALDFPNFASLTIDPGTFASDTDVVIRQCCDNSYSNLWTDASIFLPWNTLNCDITILLSTPPLSETVYVDITIPSYFTTSLPQDYGIEAFAMMLQDQSLYFNERVVFSLIEGCIYDQPSALMNCDLPSSAFADYGDGIELAVIIISATPGIRTSNLLPRKDNQAAEEETQALEMKKKNGCLASTLVCPVAPNVDCPVNTPFLRETRHPLSGSNIQRSFLGVAYSINPESQVSAAHDGLVEMVGSSTDSGVYVTLRRPDGSATRYNHLSESVVSMGDSVVVEQQIGVSSECTYYDCKKVDLVLEYVPSGTLFNNKHRIDPDPCIRETFDGSITCGDNGSQADDAFRLSLNGDVIGETSIGETNAIGISNLKSGSYTLTLEVIIAPDNVGTYFVQLNDGVTFENGGARRTGSSSLGTSLNWTIIVP